MVRTVSPKASATPTSPIPTSGNLAAITALPHPAKVSQNVPIASARYLWILSLYIGSSSQTALQRRPRREPLLGREQRDLPRSRRKSSHHNHAIPSHVWLDADQLRLPFNSGR